MKKSHTNTFAECVVIPVETYDKLRAQVTSETQSAARKILDQEHMSSDLKMKLFNQSQRAHSTAQAPLYDDKTEWIIQQFAVNERELVKRLFHDYIDKNRHIVDYKPGTLEMRLNGIDLPESNIVHTLKWLLRVNEHSHLAPPTGTDKLKESLVSIGVPSSWLRTDPAKQQPREEPEFFTGTIPEIMPVHSTPIDPGKTTNRATISMTPIMSKSSPLDSEVHTPGQDIDQDMDVDKLDQPDWSSMSTAGVGSSSTSQQRNVRTLDDSDSEGSKAAVSEPRRTLRTQKPSKQYPEQVWDIHSGSKKKKSKKSKQKEKKLKQKEKKTKKGSTLTWSYS